MQMQMKKTNNNDAWWNFWMGLLMIFFALLFSTAETIYFGFHMWPASGFEGMCDMACGFIFAVGISKLWKSRNVNE
jgi:hypothetical protein